jgi:Ca2+-binding RTX toxin-like protein
MTILLRFIDKVSVGSKKPPKPFRVIFRSQNNRIPVRKPFAIERLESRDLLATVPVLLGDLNNEPNQYADSRLLQWPINQSFPSARFFLAEVGQEAVLWKYPDGGVAEKLKTYDPDDVQIEMFCSDDLFFVHQSNGTETILDVFDQNGMMASSHTFAFGSQVLGGLQVNDTIIVQNLITNSILSIDTSGISVTIVSENVTGMVETIAQTTSHLLLRDSQAGLPIDYTIYTAGFGTFSTTNTQPQLDDAFYTTPMHDASLTFDDGELWVLNTDLTKSSSVAKLTSAPDTAIQIANITFCSYFDALNNTTQIERITYSGQISQTIATLEGKAVLHHWLGRLIVSVTDGNYQGVWTEDMGTDGLVQNEDLAQFELGEGRSIYVGFDSLIGWCSTSNVGIEPCLITPSNWIGMSSRFTLENYAVREIGRLLVPSLSGAYQFELVDGIGDDDNSSFTITSYGAVIVNELLDYEREPVQHIRVRFQDETVVSESSLSILVSDIFERVTLVYGIVQEDSPIGKRFGTLDTTGYISALPTFNYAVVAVDGNPSSTLFSTYRNKLVVQGQLDFESARSHVVTVRSVTNQGSLTESDVIVTVRNVNENEASPLKISRDFIDENATSQGYSGPMIGQLYAPSLISETVNFDFVPGPGDFDNDRFLISGDRLILSHVPNYESDRNYSVRIRATAQGVSVEGVLTIDVLPQDEFDPITVRFQNSQSASTDFLRIAENTAIGTIVTSVQVFDRDQGETHDLAILGPLSNYLQLIGDQLVLINELDFEAIAAPEDLGLSITITNPRSGRVYIHSQSGIHPTASPPEYSVIDVNEAPILASVEDFSLPTTFDARVLLGNPFLVDDAFDLEKGIQYSEIKVNGLLPPSWFILDPRTGELLATPAEGDEGVYEVSVMVYDWGGLSAVTSFRLTITAPNPLIIDGTDENDLFVVTPGYTFNDWTIHRNGLMVYSGDVSLGRPILINGGLGLDRLLVQGTEHDDRLQIFGVDIYFSSILMRSNSIEGRRLKGNGGDDLFEIDIAAGATYADVTVQGNLGDDSIRAIGQGSEWLLEGRGRGSVSSLKFESMNVVEGTYGEDQFRLTHNSETELNIRGSSGNDRLIYDDSISAIETLVTSFSRFAGQSSRTNGFSSVERIDGPSGKRNTLSYSPEATDERGASWGVSSEVIYFGQDSVFAMHNFKVLLGTVRNDSFVMGPDVAQSDFTISAVAAPASANYLTYHNSSEVEIDLAKKTAPGVKRFEGINVIISNIGINAIVRGENADATWEFNSNSLGVIHYTSANMPYLQLISFSHAIGGSKEDVFVVNGTFASSQTATIDGGLGRNRLDYSGSSTQVRVNLTRNSATAFRSIARIQDVVGSFYDDTIRGSREANRLFGRGGNDKIHGLSGDDLIFGGDGDDSIYGGSSRDWIVGGFGADSIIGGHGEDLLVSGLARGFENPEPLELSFVGNYALTAIDAVMKEWTSGRTYPQRIQRLTNGIGLLDIAITSSTLGSDLDVDTVFGNENYDWFWLDVTDIANDRRVFERRSWL